MSKKCRLKNTGIAMLLVLMVVMVAVIMATVGIAFITSQSRLLHHQMSRMQAYYACQAGINYTIEMLSLGSAGGGWDVGTNCAAVSPCTLTFDADDFLPPSIVGNSVSIVIRAAGTSGCTTSPGNTACISVTADYTHTLS